VIFTRARRSYKPLITAICVVPTTPTSQSGRPRSQSL
jgi:hypothetical protein